jgi:hypothetical protein
VCLSSIGELRISVDVFAADARFTGHVMANTYRDARQALALIFAAYLVLPAPANAADLQPQTARAYDRYIELTTAQVDSELARQGPYLWVERLPPAQRAEDQQ